LSSYTSLATLRNSYLEILRHLRNAIDRRRGMYLLNLSIRVTNSDSWPHLPFAAKIRCRSRVWIDSLL